MHCHPRVQQQQNTVSNARNCSSPTPTCDGKTEISHPRYLILAYILYLQWKIHGCLPSYCTNSIINAAYGVYNNDKGVQKSNSCRPTGKEKLAKNGTSANNTRGGGRGRKNKKTTAPHGRTDVLKIREHDTKLPRHTHTHMRARTLSVADPPLETATTSIVNNNNNNNNNVYFGQPNLQEAWARRKQAGKLVASLPRRTKSFVFDFSNI